MTFNARMMRIGNLNVRSLFTGFVELRMLILENDFDVLVVTETWLSDNVGDSLMNIPGYKLFVKNRAGRGGGVAAYIKNALNCLVLDFDFPINENLEYLFLKFKFPSNTLIIGNFYKPPRVYFNNVIDDFEKILSFVYPLADHVVCTGDFNVDQLVLDNPLLSCFESYGFVQVINEPTRITATSATLLDPIFVSNTNSNTEIIWHDICRFNFRSQTLIL